MGNKNFIYYIAGAGVFLILIVLLVLGCSNKNKDKTKTSGGDTLVIWDTENNSKAYKSLFNSFQNKYNIKIDYQIKDKNEYLTKSLEAISGDKGPDIWIIPNNYLPKYKDQVVPMPEGWMTDKKTKKSDTEVFRENYPFAVSQESIINDRIYGVPLYIDPLVLFLNRSILSTTLRAYDESHRGQNIKNVENILSSGPATWDDFIFASNLITQKNGKNINLSGAAMGTADNIDSSVDILTLLMMQFGAKMTSDDFSTAQFHTKQNLFSGDDFPGTKALEFYTNFANSENDNYSWNAEMEDSVRAFSEGKIAMTIDYESNASEFIRLNKDLSYKKIAVPQVKETKNPVNLIRYNTYTVPRSSKNQEWAWSFILFVIEKDNASKFNNVAQRTLALNQTGFPTQSWYIPDPQKIPDLFKEMIRQVNTGVSAQTAIENAASQVTTLLGQLNK